jgi:hypothetical protein
MTEKGENNGQSCATECRAFEIGRHQKAGSGKTENALPLHALKRTRDKWLAF